MSAKAGTTNGLRVFMQFPILPKWMDSLARAFLELRVRRFIVDVLIGPTSNE